MTFTSHHESAFEELAKLLDGAVIRPGDATWDEARAAWNLAIDQQPAAVVTPSHVEDIGLILKAAHATGLDVSVQPGGHGANGDLAGCILLRPSAFDEVTVHVEERFARVGAGVRFGALLPALEGTGLIALAGTTPDVNVTGYMLSGGHSWFSRWKGLAAHSIRAVELVDAAGELRRVTAESDPELLWALRGGGGLFGVVTALEIDLFEAPELFGGKILFPGAAAEAVFTLVDAVMAEAPDELTIFPGLLNMPDAPFVPEPMRGQTFATADVVFVGPADAGSALLAPLLAGVTPLADMTRPFTISQLGEVADEPQDPSAALDWSATLTDMSGSAWADLIAGFRTASPAGLTMVVARPLGGAIASTGSRSGSDTTGVVGHLDADYLIFAAAFVMDPTRVLDLDDIFGPLEDAVAGRTVQLTVPTFLVHGQGLADAYGEADLARLAEIKRRVDPYDVIRSNRGLPA
ncbi:FAD-binding oxidoreductase [Leifsonia kafniensis]|uniref:FAD-binding oxidoreductase n=1 Tax=Leifsonia kafniensis TaxID=475957 RepID=A0ABP7KAJ8_9MICO